MSLLMDKMLILKIKVIYFVCCNSLLNGIYMYIYALSAGDIVIDMHTIPPIAKEGGVDFNY
jgi:hypothetical protein